MNRRSLLITNRVLALLLGAGLAVVGAVLVVDSALVAVDRSPTVISADAWYRELTTTFLGDGVVLAVCIGLVLLGTVLLVLQTRPRRPRRIPIEVGDHDLASAQARWYLAKREAERRLARAALERGEHAETDVRLRRTRHGWQARADLRSVDVDAEQVEDRLRDELQRLLAPETTVRARVLAPKDER